MAAKAMPQITHATEILVQDSWVRVGAMTGTYYDIAEAAFAQYLEEERALVPEPSEDSDPTDYMEQDRRMTFAGIKTVVFSAMCIEAAAFDFAAVHVGDSYAEQYLDKLDLVSKWIVVPRLVCGKSLNERGAAINSLRTLVRARNSLVHHKSLPLDSEYQSLRKAQERAAGFRDSVHTSFRSVVFLSLELNSLLGSPIGVLPPFEKEVLSSKVTPELVRPEIHKCRQAHGKRKP